MRDIVGHGCRAGVIDVARTPKPIAQHSGHIGMVGKKQPYEAHRGTQ